MLGCNNNNNPYAAFDPEGAIIKGYVGISTQELTSADKTLTPFYNDDGTVAYYSKTVTMENGTDYEFICFLTKNVITEADYNYKSNSNEDLANEAVTEYKRIKSALGGPDVDKYGYKDFSYELLMSELTRQSTNGIKMDWYVENYTVEFLLTVNSNGRGGKFSCWIH